MPQRLIPGIGYVDETRNGQALIPGIGYIDETSGAAPATALSLSGPTSGLSGVQSSDFIVAADGAITGTVTVTPSDGGAGGTFSPTSINLTSGSTSGTFSYTAAGGTRTVTISITNNGGLNNPSGISYAVTAAPTGACTSQVINGQTVTFSGTTTNVPASGLATLTATGNGAVTQGPTAITLGSGTFTMQFDGVPPGDYAPTISLTNAAGTASVTGLSSFSILGIGGGIEDSNPSVSFRIGVKRSKSGIGARRR